MISSMRIAVLFAAAVAVLFSVMSIVQTTSGGDEPSPVMEESSCLEVVSSIYPITSIVENLGGDRVQASTLLPPGGSAHLHEATPSTMHKARSADLAVLVGGDLDEWAQQILDSAGHSTSMELIPKAQKLITEEEVDWSNPHVWLDPILVRDGLIPALEEELSRIDPENASHYKDNAESFQEALTALDRDLHEMFSDAPNRAFISDHPAWSHFAGRYGLKEVGVIERTPGHEAGPREVSVLLERAKENNVYVITTTRGHGTMLADSVADQLEGIIVELDPIGAPECDNRSRYVDLLRYNAVRLLEALADRDTRSVPE